MRDLASRCGAGPLDHQSVVEERRDDPPAIEPIQYTDQLSHNPPVSAGRSGAPGFMAASMNGPLNRISSVIALPPILLNSDSGSIAAAKIA